MRYRWILFAAVVAAVSIAHAGKVYRWTGEDGEPVYGEQPPNGVEATLIRVDSGGDNGDDGDRRGGREATGERSPARNDQPAEADAETAGEVDEAFVKKQCQSARQTLASLEQGGPGGRYITEDDKVVRYSREQYDARVAKSESFIERFCQD